MVERALDEFDEVPLTATCRRAVRIAHLLGETKTALRFAYEIKFRGGDKTANAEDVRRLMVDPSQWGDEDGPAITALNEFMADRSLSDGSGKLAAHTLEEIDYLLAKSDDVALAETQAQFRGFRTVAAGRIFTQLCAWERRLGASTAREGALAAHQDRVDEVLERDAPEVLAQFNAVFRRLEEAAQASLDRATSEELAQAVTTCRRILKAVVDAVQPVNPEKLTSATGHALNDATYKNRLFEFLKHATPSGTHGSALTSASQSLWERFEATDSLSSKGVHANVARDEAELCALNTYLVAGEVLRLYSRQSA